MNYSNQKRRATDSIFSGDDFDGFIKTIKKFKASVAYTAEQQLLRLSSAKQKLEAELSHVVNTKAKSIIGIAKRFFKIRELEREINDIFEKMVSWMRATCRHFSKSSHTVSH